LSKYWDGRIVGCPGTIDNDLIGSDATIGFSTAVSTAVDAIDKIRDTAESHDRMFLIEVMGRHSGYIAVYSALAGGAEIACVPESITDIAAIVEHVHMLKARGKKSILMIVAEGDEVGGAPEVAEQLKQAGCPYPIRYVVLGHLLRGGTPTPEDRMLASKLGDFAVRSALQGATGVMAGVIGGTLSLTAFAETLGVHKAIPRELFDLMRALAS
jgi:6-phosphofructokinase 1